MSLNAEKSMPWVLVTGASSGIGESMARGLARRGFPLVLAARNMKKLEALAAELSGSRGVKAVAVQADLSLPGAAAALRQACISKGIEVSVLVNNAGVGLFGRAIEQAQGETGKALRDMIALNVLSLTELCALFGKDMAERGSGRILNVASMVGLMAVPYFAAYAATKAYVRSYSAALRAELKPRGVIVSCLYPGYVKTNFDAASHADNEAYKALSGKMGMSPEKVAEIGIRTIIRGSANKVAGFSNALGAFFIGLIPKGFLAMVINRFMGKFVS